MEHFFFEFFESMLILTTLCTGTIAAGFNESCTADFNCTESVPNTKCSDDSLCVCNDNYVYSTNKCITLPIVTITSYWYFKVIGDNIIIPCTVSGDDVTSAYWTFTRSGTKHTLPSAGISDGRYSVSALPNPGLTISTLNTTDTGTYKCKASNTAGWSSDTATLSVIGDLPTVIIQSQYIKLIGEPITISCTVSGTPAVALVVWAFTPTGGSEQILTTGGRYTITSVYDITELKISSLVISDSGSYTCKATSAAGQSSNSTTLIVGGGILNVTVTPPPTIKIGEDVTIICVLNGQPTATDVQWKRNDSVIDISNTARYTGGSVATPSLTIKSVTRGDAGSFQCLATNDAGTGESNKVTLTTMDRQFGDSCRGDLPCDDIKNLQCVNNKCECKNTHYPQNNVCHTRKQLNEACNSVMLCVNEPQVTCNGAFCVCNTGYYDDNGQTTGGSCQARKVLGVRCNTTVLCLENIRCATDNKCRCPDNFYDDNKNNPGGTCKDINELKVTAFTLTVTTNTITVTWIPPTAQAFVSRYDVSWRITGSGSAYSTRPAAESVNTLTISQGLMAGQAYDVFIESVDNYTQVGEQMIVSDTEVIRLKPNPPGSVTNPSTLDAPNINLMWTASPNSVVTKYMVTLVQVGATENTTNNTPSLTLQTALVPGTYYKINITAVSGTKAAPGGETVSVVHEERVRTMVEKPSPPLNVRCPMNPKDRSLEITWSAPANPNGIIQYYKVYVYYANGVTKEVNQTTASVTTFNVQNLTPESTFGFAVSAVNDGDENIKTSDLTTRIYCTTKAALSTVPLNLAVSNIESRNITVNFNKPATTNGKLTGYVLLVYQEEKTPQKCVQKILLRCSNCGKDYTFIHPSQSCAGREVYQDVSNLPDALSITYIVLDLLPHMGYTVEAAGIQAAGEGNLAKLPNFIKTKQEAPQISTVQNIVTTASGREQAQTTTFVVELTIDFLNDNSSGQVEYYGIAVCRIDKYIELTVQQGVSSDAWRNLPNFQTAKNQGYPPYRVTDGRFIQRVTETVSQGRRKRSTTFKYTIGSETCANNTYYCNGPLPPGTSFNVIVFVCTGGGCTHSGPLGPYRTLGNAVTDNTEYLESWKIVIIVLSALAVAIVVVIIVIVRIRTKRKNDNDLKKILTTISTALTIERKIKRGRTPSKLEVGPGAREELTMSHKNKEDTYTDLTMRNINHTQSLDEAYTSLHIRSIRRNRPIPVTNFLVQKMELEADSRRLLAIEFNDLTSLSVSVPCTKASRSITRHKNRSQSIIPSDQQRLKLGEKSDTTEDYINASLIQIPLMSDQFDCIATQHPLPETNSDFWQMIWERNTLFIVMLNSISECENVQYWPIEEGGLKTYGTFTVKVVACFSSGERSVHRVFEVSKGKKVRNIKQLHFENWKSFSKRDVNPMLDFLEMMETNIEKSKTRSSTVIHCSDGSGRTGVYICVHFLISLIKKGASKIDVFDTAYRLLQCRKNIIETEEQYHFIYECLGAYITDKLGDGGSMTRQSVQFSTLQRYANTNDKDVYEQIP